MRFRPIHTQDGPCYDYCMCKTCWNGWTRTPRLWRLVSRLEYLATNGYAWPNFLQPIWAWLQYQTWKVQ